KVGKAALLITASSPSDITYGDAAPAVSASFARFGAGTTAVSLSSSEVCGSGHGVGSPVGTYATTCSGAASGNYSISYAPGSFKRSEERRVGTEWSPSGMTYGDAAQAVSASYATFVAGDTADSLTTKPTCGTGYG